MAADKQSEKLKQRLHQWHSYAAEATRTDYGCSQEENDDGVTNRETGDIAPFTLPASALPETLSAPRENKARLVCGEDHYEDQIAHLEAELARERAHAQEMAVKWGSEVLRRQRETQQSKTHPQPKVRTLAIEDIQPSTKRAVVGPKPQQAQKSGHNYLPLLVICLGVFLAGISSVIALNLVWSWGH